jgi:lycopene beta-cyclase
MAHQKKQVDFLFAGGGAAATILLMSMERHGLLAGKSWVVVEPSPKTSNDKTFCFWGKPDELPAAACSHLISKQWGFVRVNNADSESLSPQYYHHVSSLDLYNELRRLIDRHAGQIIHTRVHQTTIENGRPLVFTDTEVWSAALVFDSRTPTYLPAKNNEAHLIQSFLGYLIQTENAVADISTVDLMDFNIDQQNTTQFVYVLPYDATTLLVELTRFSESPISETEAEPLLVNYIQRRYGSFTILNIERGNIPMSSAAINLEEQPGFISIGGRGGAIKPSTGYAFKNMFLQAEQICQTLKYNLDYKADRKKERFELYDRLLLSILSRKPALGKPIFESLFKKNNASSVLRFLDEKSSWGDELKIFMSLPKRPFINALIADIYYRHRTSIPNLVVLLFGLCLWLFYSLNPTAYSIVEPWILGVGLFVWGIPHGAVDHLVEGSTIRRYPGISFVLLYLLASFLFGVLWFVYAPLALLLFLGYSVWHFGEGDMMEWYKTSLNSTKIWGWGSIPLSAILFSHLDETNHIVQQLGVTPLLISSELASWVSLGLIGIGLFWSVFEKQIPMLLCCILLIIGTTLPLLSAFGLYFIGQHSFVSWSHLKQRLHLSDTSLYIKALPFTIGALSLLAGLIYVLNNDYYQPVQYSSVVKNFFIFISCISFPHVLIMHRFYHRIH